MKILLGCIRYCTFSDLSVTLPYTLEQTDRQTDRQNQDRYCCVRGSPSCCQRGFQEVHPSAPPTDNPNAIKIFDIELGISLWPCRLVSSGKLTRIIQSWFELVDPHRDPRKKGGRRGNQPRLLRNQSAPILTGAISIFRAKTLLWYYGFGYINVHMSISNTVFIRTSLYLHRDRKNQLGGIKK